MIIKEFFTSHLDDNHFGYKQKFRRNGRAKSYGDISPHKKIISAGVVRMRNFCATFACMHKEEIMKTKN